MAPEQLTGRTTPRTDVFSLGKLLQYLLLAADPKPLHAIAAKASNPDAALRFPGVLDLAHDIELFLDGQPVSAYRDSLLEHVQRQISRHKTLAVLILTYIAVRTAIFFFTRR
jgi:serine/threonine protein kinase